MPFVHWAVAVPQPLLNTRVCHRSGEFRTSACSLGCKSLQTVEGEGWDHSELLLLSLGRPLTDDLERDTLFTWAGVWMSESGVQSRPRYMLLWQLQSGMVWDCATGLTKTLDWFGRNKLWLEFILWLTGFSENEQNKSRLKIKSLGHLCGMLLGLSLRFSVRYVEGWKYCTQLVLSKYFIAVFLSSASICYNFASLRGLYFVKVQSLSRSRNLRSDAVIRGRNEVNSSHESSHSA